MAMGVAAALDALNWPEILGCIAGDDTVMCVENRQAGCRQKLEDYQERRLSV